MGRTKDDPEMDDPEMDGTDYAHPAWWRGHDQTVEVMCIKIQKLLDGEVTNGVCREPYQSIRLKIIKLIEKITLDNK